FSITTGCPHFFASQSAKMRGITSAVPPAGNGTMILTVRDGKASAKQLQRLALSKANIIAHRKQKPFPRSVKAASSSLRGNSGTERLFSQDVAGQRGECLLNLRGYLKTGSINSITREPMAARKATTPKVRGVPELLLESSVERGPFNCEGAARAV